MIEQNVQESRFPMKAVILVVLLLAILPLVLFILIQFAPPRESGPSSATETENASGKSAAARSELKTVRSGGEEKTEYTASVPVDAVDEPWPDDPGVPEDISVVGAGAVVPNAPRSKQATPYPPGMVPGDSGIVPQLAEPPEDLP